MRIILKTAIAVVGAMLVSNVLLAGSSNPPPPQPITCAGGNAVTAFSYGTLPTCGSPIAGGTINTGTAGQIADYSAATTVAPITTGTGVVTALGVNTGSAGAFVVNGGALGTPSAGTLTNATGLPISTGISGLGTGIATALAVNAGSAGSAVINGGVLGTPSSGSLTNLTGLPLTTGVTGVLPAANGGTGLSSLGTGVATFLGTPSSANLLAALTTKTGTGLTVFGTAPTVSALTLSDVATGTQCLHANSAGLISGTGSDCGAGGSGLTVGTSTITSGTTGRLFYDNAGVLGEAVVGSGLSLLAGTLTATAGGGGTVTNTAGALPLHAPIVGNGSADIKALAALTNGQFSIGVTGADMAAGSFGPDFTNSSNTINLAQRTAHGDSIYTILSTDRYVVTSATLTAARVWTLPAASAVPGGTQYQVYDEAGGVSATNTIAITPAGTDTINGGNNASSSTIGVAYGGYTLKTDGVSKWTATANTVQQAYTCAATKFATSQSGAGVTTCTQPAFTDISGNIAVTQMNSGTSASSSTFWRGDGAWATPAGAGTVTNAANLTDKAIVVGSGGTTGVATLSSLGTSGQVLTSNGAGVLPSFQAAGGGSGALTLVATVSPPVTTNCGSIKCFAFVSGITARMQLKCSGMFGSNGTVSVAVQFTEDAGATWKTAGAAYDYDEMQSTAGVVQAFAGQQGGGPGPFHPATSGTVGATYHIDLDDLTSTTINKIVLFRTGYVNASAAKATLTGSFYYNGDTGAINGMRIIDIQGSPVDISSGSCSLYSLQS